MLENKVPLQKKSFKRALGGIVEYFENIALDTSHSQRIKIFQEKTLFHT